MNSIYYLLLAVSSTLLLYFAIIFAPHEVIAQTNLEQEIGKEVESKFKGREINTQFNNSEQKKITAVLIKYYRGLANQTLKVRNNYQSYSDSTVFDFTILKTPQELSQWQSISNRYYEVSKELLDYYDSMEKKVKANLEAEKLEAKHIEAFLKGFRTTSHNKLAPRKLYEVHFKLASGVREFLSFLIKNQSKWTIDHEIQEPISEDESFNEKYDSWIEKLQSDEQEMNKMIEHYGG